MVLKPFPLLEESVFWSLGLSHVTKEIRTQEQAKARYLSLFRHEQRNLYKLDNSRLTGLGTYYLDTTFPGELYAQLYSAKKKHQGMSGRREKTWKLHLDTIDQ